MDVKVLEEGLISDVNKGEGAAFQPGSSAVSAANQGWVTEQLRWGGITCVRYFPHCRSSHTVTSLLSSLLFSGPVYSCTELLGLESVPGCSPPPPPLQEKKRKMFMISEAFQCYIGGTHFEKMKIHFMTAFCLRSNLTLGHFRARRNTRNTKIYKQKAKLQERKNAAMADGDGDRQWWNNEY